MSTINFLLIRFGFTWHLIVITFHVDIWREWDTRMDSFETSRTGSVCPLWPYIDFWRTLCKLFWDALSFTFMCCICLPIFPSVAIKTAYVYRCAKIYFAFYWEKALSKKDATNWGVFSSFCKLDVIVSLEFHHAL